ncbi:MAG: bifunctional demethylmenaquinone methyltransferase/2-methoxy-6-polyprenyl-1,4-benzoquinol methylase UbiE [Saprospiraceae bacterium]|nr:bifunctional demethylmenaquinone methyltransferase/2-methoxy-6-polyprenyl-1,4-benzoquinol methylase UbiE [Saprospiraceae bacterium]
MEVKPYEIDGSKKQQVSQMFDNIAGKYDFLNHFLSLNMDKTWRRKMIAELNVLQPKTVLDVATGTADVAINTIKQLKINNLKIEGVDISAEMLNIGRKKISHEGLSERITLSLGDSEQLPFEGNKFDAVTVAFGVRNFENLERGLQEMHRVLRGGGKLVVLEFSKPTMFPFRQLYNFYFKNILPMIGKLTSKDNRAYAYLYESVQAFPDGDNFLTVLNKIGFKETQCKPLTLGICSIYIGYKK